MTDPLPTAAPRWTLRHIIAATDFSTASEHAIERAALLAQEHRARLTLAHVVPASPWEDIGSRVAAAVGIEAVSHEAARKTAAEQLRRRTSELSAQRGLACDLAVVAGRPAARLAQLASREAADLLVVGAHGAHPVRQLMVGATAQKLLRLSPCPVLVVKRAPPFDYRRVLVPTDFSSAARGALRAAAALLPQARLHVAHAFELPYDDLLHYAPIGGEVIARYHAAARERLLPELDAWTEEAGIASGRHTLHVEHGYPPTLIEQWVDALDIDLVAIAAHGTSELEDTLLGSVSLHTVQAAPCDVLLVRGAVVLHE